MFFNPDYLLFILPAVLLSLWAPRTRWPVFSAVRFTG